MYSRRRTTEKGCQFDVRPLSLDTGSRLSVGIPMTETFWDSDVVPTKGYTAASRHTFCRWSSGRFFFRIRHRSTLYKGKKVLGVRRCTVDYWRLTTGVRLLSDSATSVGDPNIFVAVHFIWRCFCVCFQIEVN